MNSSPMKPGQAAALAAHRAKRRPADRLTAALGALNSAIGRGEEFPDASYRAAAFYLVPYASLVAAYDEQGTRPA